jgi:tRNA threonylcarbamoyladenosine biosynthesis protein TsaB
MILAFDSTAKVASVALLDGEKILAEYSVDCGLTQSELLLPMAEHCLASVHKGFEDVTALACTVGPGSFTGVRIGVATVKGLAFGKNIPCIEVSTLEALAENLRGLRGYIAAVMDARRNQVYNALFYSDGETLERITEDRAISLDALAEELKPIEEKGIYLVGDGYDVAKKQLLAAGVALFNTPRGLRAQSGASCAAVAKRRLAENQTATDREISPSYLRLPQAERERLERENQAKQ